MKKTLNWLLTIINKLQKRDFLTPQRKVIYPLTLKDGLFLGLLMSLIIILPVDRVEAAGIYIGDSITQGMSKYLPAGSTVLAETGKAASYFENKISSLPSSADYVSVNLGVNNPGDISSMKNLLSNLKEKYGDTPIYVNQVLPVGSNYSSGSLSASAMNKMISEYNTAISSYAQSLGLKVVDVSSGLVDANGYLRSDIADSRGLHPSGAYEQLAQNVLAAAGGGGSTGGSGTTGSGSSGTGGTSGGSTSGGTSGGTGGGTSGTGSSTGGGGSTLTGGSGSAADYTEPPEADIPSPLDEPSDSAMEISELCSNIDDSTGKCASCASSGGLWTAIGCLPTNVETLAPKLISIILGIAGLLLTIRILIAGAQIIFSAGDSNALNKARTSIINSVIALLFIIFGATFLQIIGVKIFDIPGFFQ